MKKGNPTEAASNTHENTDENAYVFDIQESCIKVNDELYKMRVKLTAVILIIESRANSMYPSINNLKIILNSKNLAIFSYNFKALY